MRLALALIAAMLASPALANPDISIDDAVVRVPGAMAMAGAAYFTIHNAGDSDDRLIAVSSDAAKRAALHSSVADGAVMRMVTLDDGIVVPAGETRALVSGGDHVMLMGLTDPLEPGEMVHLTLVFEQAGELSIEIPVGPAASDSMGDMAQ